MHFPYCCAVTWPKAGRGGFRQFGGNQKSKWDKGTEEYLGGHLFGDDQVVSMLCKTEIH